MRKSNNHGLPGHWELYPQRRQDRHYCNRSKAFDLVPNDRLLTKIAISGVDSRVFAWVRAFLLGRTQRVRVGGQLYEEVRLMSGVPQVSLLCLLLFLAYVNDIWRNIVSTIRLLADDCVIYKDY